MFSADIFSNYVHNMYQGVLKAVQIVTQGVVGGTGIAGMA